MVSVRCGFNGDRAARCRRCRRPPRRLRGGPYPCQIPRRLPSRSTAPPAEPVANTSPLSVMGPYPLTIPIVPPSPPAVPPAAAFWSRRRCPARSCPRHPPSIRHCRHTPRYPAERMGRRRWLKPTGLILFRSPTRCRSATATRGAVTAGNIRPAPAILSFVFPLASPP